MAEEDKKMKVTLIGAGPGSPEMISGQAAAVLSSADLILGSGRLLKSLGQTAASVMTEAVRTEEIMACVRQCNAQNICVLFSGDSGFYSGAVALLPLLEQEGIETEVLPGISSVQLMAARLKMPWQDWELVSAHGVSCDAADCVRKAAGRPVLFLTGGRGSAEELCRQLTRAGMGAVSVIAGIKLSAPDENIIYSTAAELADNEIDTPNLLLVLSDGAAVPSGQEEAYHAARSGDESDENESSSGRQKEVFYAARSGDESDENESSSVRQREVFHAARSGDDGSGENPSSSAGQNIVYRASGIPDDEFIRGNVPMTKQEVRSVICGKLGIRPGMCCWDVGAGTGSVGIEMAMQGCRVWAVEKDDEACRLIRLNREHFDQQSLSLVQGRAPEILKNLPKADAVFIGGSGGALQEILKEVRRLCPSAAVCVSAISLETLNVAEQLLDQPGYDTDIVQIAVSRARKTGQLHMLMAQNPVFLITSHPSAL